MALKGLSANPDDIVVIGIDPGLTTGIAAYSPGGLFALNTSAQFASSEIIGRHPFYDAFDRIVASAVPLVVVMEAFLVNMATAQKSSQLDPIYIIGAIERQCAKLGIPFHCQTPATAKAFASDDKLKAIDWYQPGKGHANDAARHLLTHMVSQRQEFGGRALLTQLTGAIFG